jgi:ribosome-associated protein
VKLDSVRPELRWAIEAAQDKQAENVTVLKLGGLGAFAEYFLLCSGASDRQIHAISEAIEEKLDRQGVPHGHREGKHGAEWVLLDYGGFVVHIFSERARLYYDLERLWRAAERLDVPSPGARVAQESQESDSDPASGRETGTDRP